MAIVRCKPTVPDYYMIMFNFWHHIMMIGLAFLSLSMAYYLRVRTDRFPLARI
ncbi:hypothetical protein JXM67_11430 [candidate division WOR-3 bacterium]|nr:hypothetical protein [candidate division WOR-3 bacterium]